MKTIVEALRHVFKREAPLSLYEPHESCQVPELGKIVAAHLGLKRDGVFVEVGAFDGESYSNTSFLADLGWRGLYFEPVPEAAAACRARHARNHNITVVECAVGAIPGELTLFVAGELTTGDAAVAEIHRQLEWARGYHTGRTLAVQQYRLDALMRKHRILRGFDLLVVDVEGAEECVFDSFDLEEFRPRMMIVELEDVHPSFDVFPVMKDRALRVRQRITDIGYVEIYRDSINTIFVDGRTATRGRRR